MGVSDEASFRKLLILEGAVKSEALSSPQPHKCWLGTEACLAAGRASGDSWEAWWGSGRFRVVRGVLHEAV